LERFQLSDDANLLRRRARRRLVGAIALVVLAVVVLPIILDQKPRPGPQELTVQIPRQDGGAFKTRVLPPLPSPPAVSPKSEPVEADSPADKPASVEPAARPASPKKESPQASQKARAKPKTAEARRAEAALNDEAFVVPLGAFSNPDNAKQVRDRAASAGIKSYTEQVKGQQGEQTRVRAGPFSSRNAAEKARDKLKSLGLEVGAVAQR
jgi:DedD protein